MKLEFGNWTVNDLSITGVFQNGVTYYIPINDIWQIRNFGGHIVWDWLIISPGKTFITKKNVADLNAAFEFCIDYFKSQRPSDSLAVSTDLTLIIQHKLLNIDVNFSAAEIASFGDTFFDIYSNERIFYVLNFENKVHLLY